MTEHSTRLQEIRQEIRDLGVLTTLFTADAAMGATRCIERLHGGIDDGMTELIHGELEVAERSRNEAMLEDSDRVRFDALKPDCDFVVSGFNFTLISLVTTDKTCLVWKASGHSTFVDISVNTPSGIMSAHQFIDAARTKVLKQASELLRVTAPVRDKEEQREQEQRRNAAATECATKIIYTLHGSKPRAVTLEVKEAWNRVERQIHKLCGAMALELLPKESDGRRRG